MCLGSTLVLFSGPAEEAEQKRRLDAAIAAAREEDARRQEREEQMSKEAQERAREDASMKHINCSCFSPSM